MMEIVFCAVSAAVGACIAGFFFIAGMKMKGAEIEHLDTRLRMLQDRDKDIESLKEEMLQDKERWLATTERLDAQGARILELEHRLQISLPKLCNDED